MIVTIGQPLPKGADAADFLESGYGTVEVLAWARSIAEPWPPQRPAPEEEIQPPEPPPHSDADIQELRHPSATDPVTGPRILAIGTPFVTAKLFLRENFWSEEGPLVHYQSDVYYGWDSTRFVEIEYQTVRSRIYSYLHSSSRYNDDGEVVPFDSTPSKVSAVQDGFEAEATLPASVKAPCWLEAIPDLEAKDIIAAKNGLLHLPSKTMIAHTPKFYNHNAVPFNYDPDYGEPREWLSFIHGLWPDDNMAIETLQEVFGYLLTQDTSQQKIFMIVGPPRSGKGTLGRVLAELIGKDNIASPTLADLGKEFGLQPLVDKQVAIIADARLDSGQTQQAIAERLLSISGEDSQTINRKNKSHWSGKLPTRFVVLTNIMPKIADASGALASRFVLLTLRESHLGREDLGLESRLLKELPGILNWAIDGWTRLRERGYFIRPPSSDETVQELIDITSPILAFVRDVCEVNPNKTCETEYLWEQWNAWRKEQGYEHTLTKQHFGRELRAAVPGIKRIERTTARGKEKIYEGIFVKNPSYTPTSDGFDMDRG